MFHKKSHFSAFTFQHMIKTVCTIFSFKIQKHPFHFLGFKKNENKDKDTFVLYYSFILDIILPTRGSNLSFLPRVLSMVFQSRTKSPLPGAVQRDTAVDFFIDLTFSKWHYCIILVCFTIWYMD